MEELEFDAPEPKRPGTVPKGLEPDALDAGYEARFAPIDFREALNDEQYAAVTADMGPALVLAGAGSGKTRTLTYRVAYLLTQGIAPWQILLLTFTNKAAREMLDRVEDLTGVPRQKFWGGTFHSIGQRIIRTHAEKVGLTKNYTILDQGDAESLFGDVIRGIDAKFTKNKENPKPRVILEIISYARNTRRDLRKVIEEKYPWFDYLADAFVSFAQKYEAQKKEQQVADYDDLLELWLVLLEKHEEVRQPYHARFRAILVDEYQDTNKLQSAIIDQLAHEHQVMAVGDDAQCIYTWRGANFANILTFPDRHPGTRIHKIETNYRSTPQILGFANGVLLAQPAESGYAKELRAVRAKADRPFLIPVMDGRQQAQIVIRRIEALHEEGRRFSDIAVLYRAHYQALDLQLEMTRRGLPFVITSGVKFFEQAHVRDLTAQIRFVHNPRDVAAFKRMTQLLPKIGERTAERLYSLAHDALFATEGGLYEKGDSAFARLHEDKLVGKVPADAREEWADLVHTLVDIDTAIRGGSPQQVVRVAVEGWYAGFIRNLYANYLSRLDDLEGLVAFAERFESVVDLLSQLVLLNSETSDKSVDLSEDSVRLTTIHQAKGLEYPVVFVIGLADGLFPLNRAIEADDLDEERRLFYVAVTRAMDELYLLYPMLNTQGGQGNLRMQPSRFLNEVPEDRYEILRVQSQSW